MIEIAELHKRKFFEINDSFFSKESLVFANYEKGCILIQNGDGYIPYTNISLVSKVGDGTPYKMITEIEQLDKLLDII